MVNNTLYFLKAEIIIKNKNEIKFENIFELKNFTLENILHFKENIVKNQNKQGIFTTKTDKILVKKIIPNILKNFNEFVSKFSENKINYLIKPNFASQKDLSTKDSEFDINALILNLINPVSNTRIYLKKKLWIKKDMELQLFFLVHHIHVLIILILTINFYNKSKFFNRIFLKFIYYI